MAFVWSSNLVDAVTNHLASYVSDASLCSRIVMNWLVQLYACYVHCWFLHLFTCNHGDMQTPFLGKPYTATSPPLFLHSDDSSHRADFHTNSSPQTSPLAVHEEDLRRIFESLDDDKDGMVSGHDIQRLLQNLGLHNNNNLASAHDDGDDEDQQYFVNFDDFCGLCVPLFAHSEENRPQEGLVEAFSIFDKNGDGFITHHDLQRLLPGLGFKEGRDLEFCRNMIQKFDTNCDGRIHFMEFKNMMFNRIGYIFQQNKISNSKIREAVATHLLMGCN